MPQQPEPDLAPFNDGIAVLRRDGEVCGWVATSVGHFRSICWPLKRQTWVWFVVVWANGDRERSFEDYPPWTAVLELPEGTFNWDGAGHEGDYQADWLPAEEASATREALGLTDADF